MTTKTFTPIRGKRLRVTELSENGAILPTSQTITTSGFITVSLTPEVEDGTEIVLRRADGALCVNEKGNPSFKGFELELEFCNVNPSLLALTTNAEEYETGSNVTGFVVPEGEMTKRFALELWTGLTGGGGGADASGYLLLPFIAAGTLGDIEIGGEDAITFSMTNSSTRGGNSWGQGPYEVVKVSDNAEKLPTALDPLDHLLMTFTDVAPPDESVQPTVVPSGD